MAGAVAGPDVTAGVTAIVCAPLGAAAAGSVTCRPTQSFLPAIAGQRVGLRLVAGQPPSLAHESERVFGLLEAGAHWASHVVRQQQQQ